MLLFKIGFLEIGWIDLLDILLAGVLLYEFYRLVKGTVAWRIILGGLALVAVWLLVSALEMRLLTTILGQFIGVGVLGALVLFQPEIRKFLLVIGKANYLSNNRWLRVLLGGNISPTNIDVEVFLEAAREMSASLTGALMVFTKGSELKFYAESGDVLDAVASKRLIVSVFNKYSPLHDGAMIIDKMGRIAAVRCILPVSENPELPAQLGLRHRSAIGLTEVSDAIVLVVSEETGTISLVRNGRIYRDMSPRQLRQRFLEFLTAIDEPSERDPDDLGNTPDFAQPIIASEE